MVKKAKQPRIYLEGGGDGKDLKTRCRKGFRKLFEKVKLQNHPKLIACGSRFNANKNFCNAIQQGPAMLLVDSEAPVRNEHQNRPWQHLNCWQDDQWQIPNQADQADCHLMVQTMESWLVCDEAALANFFGQGFKKKSLPTNNNIEQYSKQDVMQALKRATQDTSKGSYHKGKHSFEILAVINPQRIADRSAWASRFFDELRQRYGNSNS